MDKIATNVYLWGAAIRYLKMSSSSSFCGYSCGVCSMAQVLTVLLSFQGSVAVAAITAAFLLACHVRLYMPGCAMIAWILLLHTV